MHAWGRSMNGKERLVAMPFLVALALQSLGDAKAADPNANVHGDVEWSVSRYWDGGSCEAWVVLGRDKSACRVGPEAEVLMRDGGMDIYDSYAIGLVGCDEQTLVCGKVFRCDCSRIRAGASSAAHPSRKSRPGSSLAPQSDAGRRK